MGFSITLIIVALIIALIVYYKRNRTTKHESIDDRKYESIDDWKDDLVTLWEGTPLEIEFTYESKIGQKRRSVQLKKLVRNSRHELYLIGICKEKNEERTFNIERVTTMIKYKSKRFHHYDFLEEVLKVDANDYAFSA